MANYVHGYGRNVRPPYGARNYGYQPIQRPRNDTSRIRVEPETRSLWEEQARDVIGGQKQIRKLIDVAGTTEEKRYVDVAKAVALIVLVILAVIGLAVTHVASMGFASLALIGAIGLYDAWKAGRKALHADEIEEEINTRAAIGNLDDRLSAYPASEQEAAAPAQQRRNLA